MASSAIQERLGWGITPERYRQIRALWVTHSKAEDARDLAGLISTLARDCVYEIVPTGHGVALDVIIHFPWDPRHEKSAGERIYFVRAALAAAVEG